jgi:adenosylcobinamide kinase/adenosylcobinamide-phosphate guanylyltransferase
MPVSQDLILILGGARGGKSGFAEEMAARMGERVLYVATAQAGDDEMRDRIAAHRDSRPSTWTTLEAPTRVGAAIRAAVRVQPAEVVLLDCLTLLVSNVLLADLPAGGDPDRVDEERARSRVSAEIGRLLAARRATDASWIVVTNEVGWGLVPYYPLGRVYRDLLGWTNQRVAEAADRVYLLVAGLPIEVKALAAERSG